MKYIKPIVFKILVEPLSQEEKTETGVVISSLKEELPEQGRVLDIGEAVIKVAPGDLIIFKKYGAEPIEFNKHKYLIITEDDILCKIYDEASKI